MGSAVPQSITYRERCRLVIGSISVVGRSGGVCAFTSGCGVGVVRLFPPDVFRISQDKIVTTQPRRRLRWIGHDFFYVRCSSWGTDGRQPMICVRPPSFSLV